MRIKSTHTHLPIIIIITILASFAACFSSLEITDQTNLHCDFDQFREKKKEKKIHKERNVDHNGPGTGREKRKFEIQWAASNLINRFVHLYIIFAFFFNASNRTVPARDEFTDSFCFLVRFSYL